MSKCPGPRPGDGVHLRLRAQPPGQKTEGAPTLYRGPLRGTLQRLELRVLASARPPYAIYPAGGPDVNTPYIALNMTTTTKPH